jgi:translation initiation factor IF-2
MKVFELAKELNIGAVDLVDRLRASGINVRNHMVSLSEDELVAAKKVFAPASSKQVVKKVIKKKVATKEVSAVADAQMASSEAAKPSKSAVKKVVAVKRKIKSDEEDDNEDMAVDETSTLHTAAQEAVDETPNTTYEPVTAAPEAQDQETELEHQDNVKVETVQQAPVVEPVVTKVEETSAPAAKKNTIIRRELFKDDLPRGLSIVSRPKVEVKPAALQLPEDDLNDQSSAKNKASVSGVFKEKMHVFTPVFIPEAKKEDDSKKKKVADVRLRPFTQPPLGSETTDAAGGDDKFKSKKKFGDLAAMVSKTSEKKDITQLRADEELKFAHEVVGQAIYTSPKKKKIWHGETKKTLLTEVKDAKRVIYVHDGCTAEDLALKLSVKFEALANKALSLNLLLDESDYLGLTLIGELAGLFQYRVENKAFDEEKILKTAENVIVDKNADIRPPIITIMGHVDHGKTSLLDYIRSAKVASAEAGGITQHIGAYTVSVGDKVLTFLDTPGHAAFASMRQRGANVTDIVILVVAADDGVMPQTVESIKFIQNAKVPMIVAVNKIDKPDSKPEKVKQELLQYGITAEEWGGDTQFVHVSALKGTGVDELLESIAIQAEVLELRATATGSAECTVIEAKLEVGRGPVCTAIVNRGVLRKGDAIVVGESYGRARSLMDHLGKQLDSAGPSIPVQILGLDSVPSPGDKLAVVDSEREAKKLVDHRINERKAMELAEKKKLSLEDFFASNNPAEGGKKILNLIVRADVIGSYEAIKNAVESLGNDEVGVHVIAGGAGAITDNDVLLASSVKGYVVGFNMRPVTSARRLSEEKGVDVKTYTIIYELIDEIRLALEGMLAPTRIEKFIGRAQVKEVFMIPKIGAIAGSSVIDGKIERGCNIRLLREGKIVHDGKLSSLKRFKDDVKEVKNGMECGIALDQFDDVKVNDLFEAYILEEKKRTLSHELTL